MLRQRWLIAGVALACGLAVAGATLARDRTYTAATSFMPQGRRSAAGLSGIAAQFGIDLGSAEGGQSPQFYADLLTSRGLLRDLVGRRYVVPSDTGPRAGTLVEILAAEGKSAALRREDAIVRLRDCFEVVTSQKTNVVTLRVRTAHPTLSEDLGRRALAWLNEFNVSTRQSQARAERAFTEQRLNESRAELARAEGRLRAFAEANRVYEGAPALALEQSRLERAVGNQQRLYSAFLEAYERARLEEVRDTPVITVVAAPEAPARPDGRGLVLRTAFGLVGGVLLGVIVAAARTVLRPPRGQPGRDDVREFHGLAREVASDVRHPADALGRAWRSEHKGIS